MVSSQVAGIAIKPPKCVVPDDAESVPLFKVCSAVRLTARSVA